jgi:hypothetical protein
LLFVYGFGHLGDNRVGEGEDGIEGIERGYRERVYIEGIEEM